MLVELTQGYHAEIDFSDWWRIRGYTWRARVSPRTVYAVGSRSAAEHNVHMHWLIKPPPDGLRIDHIDGDGLNNRWNNLRFATNRQNSFNAYRPLSQSGYIGVKQQTSGRWFARAQKDGKQCHLGTYDTPEEAARAYDAFILADRGEFAVLNFPPVGGP